MCNWVTMLYSRKKMYQGNNKRIIKKKRNAKDLEQQKKIDKEKNGSLILPDFKIILKLMQIRQYNITSRETNESRKKMKNPEIIPHK